MSQINPKNVFHKTTFFSSTTIHCQSLPDCFFPENIFLSFWSIKWQTSLIYSILNKNWQKWGRKIRLQSTVYSLYNSVIFSLQSTHHRRLQSTVYTLVQSTIYIVYTAAQSSGTTSTFFKMNDKSKLIKHVREAPTNFCSSSFFSYIS